MREPQTLELGINIDHVATLRNARGTTYPDPIKAARLAEEAGADLITLHLREDRRHIKDADLTDNFVKEFSDLVVSQSNIVDDLEKDNFMTFFSNQAFKRIFIEYAKTLS